MKIKVKSLEDTKKIAKIFSSALTKNGLFVTLTGDIGSGKTQFVRYVLENLDIKESVTSPSFVILNEYKSSMFSIYHFDLYRLEHKGLKSIVSQLREYSKDGVLTFVEWADFAQNEIPKSSLKIDIQYGKENFDTRYFTFCFDETNKEFKENFLKRMKDEYFSNMLCVE